MHARIFSSTTIGVNAYQVHVEVDLAFGMIQFFIVGLPDTAIKESKQRITTALKNCGVRLPNRKITVNLAPADLKKEGTLFDLPIAIGILAAAKELEISKDFLDETLFLGELSLDGTIRKIKGALPIAYDAQRLGKKRLILPKENAAEASLIKDINVIGVAHLTDLISYLRNEKELSPTTNNLKSYLAKENETPLNFDQVKGQYQAKRALSIAAAGRHNIIFVGPPGAGKTMLAKRLPSIMPAMSFNEILQTTKIYSVTGKLLDKPLVTQRPFRSPHHTISQAGLVGGGSFPQPGEISLAHHGVLFLDELTEFKRTTLEVLRQPLESKTVCISRANHTVSFPASFLLVAALNPCPCGFLGDKKKECHCSRKSIEKYLEKLSGPLLDRIDLQIHIQSIEYDTIKNNTTKNTSSEDLLKQIDQAVEVQKKRYNNENTWNASMNPEQIERYCTLTEEAEKIIKTAFEKLHLSMRGYHKILKIARTIADLEQSDMIESSHIKEAVFYRSLDQTIERMKQ